MELSKRTKMLLGAASLWPILYIFLFVIFVFAMFASIGPGNGSPVLGAGFIVVFFLHMFTILLTLGLTVFYVIHAIKNEKLSSDMKIVWVVLFFFVGMFAHPVYWYREIWTANERDMGMLPSPSAYSSTQSQDARQPNYAPPTEPPDWR